MVKLYGAFVIGNRRRRSTGSARAGCTGRKRRRSKGSARARCTGQGGGGGEERAVLELGVQGGYF
jgi:hypothetical protein